MVILWTDALVYLLVALSLLLAIKAFSQSKLRRAWREVIYRPLNLVAILFLMIYIIIGLLDTIHYKKAEGGNETEIISLLDQMLYPLPWQSEKTYSAPFATHGFSKEIITEGSAVKGIIRDYPRLIYGGGHLKDPQKKWQDIRTKGLQAAAQSVLIWAALSIIFLVIGRFNQSHSWDDFISRVIIGKTLFPWRTFLCSIALIIFLFLFIHAFIPYYHILGTSQIGEDVFYQSLKGIRTGLVIGTITTLITLPFAVLFGVMAGYFRGWMDDLIQYLYTTLSSIPGVLLIASAILTLEAIISHHAHWFESSVQRADARLLALCAILGITSWTSLCRLLRAETLKICEMDYIQAAHSLGSSHLFILLRHIVPNVFHIILITVALDFSGLVLAEAVLSYVGVGVDPSSYSWGTMINSARLELARMPIIWWNLTAVFVFMFALVLSANIFADALRDAFDPRGHHMGEK